LISFLTGFIASVQHVVTGPDHMAAVTPLAIDSKKKSWLIGLGWGLGHTVGMLIIGGLFLLFKEILPIDSIAKHSDQLIGILLIVIGCWSVLRTYLRYHQSKKSKPQFHTHQYSSYTITHLHDDAVNSKNEHAHKHVKPVKQNAFAALCVGVVHGASGFNHLLALLPTLALPTMRQSVLYVIAFALGTVTVMIIFAFFMGLIAHRSEIRNQDKFLKWFTYAGGTAAIIIGIIWLLGWGI
jgi:cytochrome c biogenesis protein CcdA